jgi:S-adenosylmethionine:tRNA ribosyltransferase-isomerase
MTSRGDLVSDFDFDLPESLIAQHPVPRGSARLLVVRRAEARWEERSIRDLPSLLTPGDLMVANDTRVFPARLLGRRDPSGGAVECLLLEQVGADEWHALVHPGQKLKPGAQVIFENAERAPGVQLFGEILTRRFHGRRVVRLWPAHDAVSEIREPGPLAPHPGPAAHPPGPLASDAGPLTHPQGPLAPVAAIVDAIGHVPLPPYIHRDDEPDDRERYQTVFARERGSIAAPTAGLHFDDALLASLAAAGIRWATVTLHVGYGTFKPVRVERVADHQVDAEAFTIPAATADAIARTRAAGRRVVAVGTTTTRALETASAATGEVVSGGGATSLFISPGHEFRAVDALLTNFHLPKSSLLMLVAAFAGRDLTLAAYRDAVRRGFRFYSYGDAMLLT